MPSAGDQAYGRLIYPVFASLHGWATGFVSTGKGLRIYYLREFIFAETLGSNSSVLILLRKVFFPLLVNVVCNIILVK